MTASFAKIFLYEDGRLTEVKQTSTVTCDQNTRTAEYKQAYMFGLGRTTISNVQFIVEV